MELTCPCKENKVARTLESRFWFIQMCWRDERGPLTVVKRKKATRARENCPATANPRTLTTVRPSTTNSAPTTARYLFVSMNRLVSEVPQKLVITMPTSMMLNQVTGVSPPKGGK